jgi:hypothetical protein
VPASTPVASAKGLPMPMMRSRSICAKWVPLARLRQLQSRNQAWLECTAVVTVPWKLNAEKGCLPRFASNRQRL